MEVEADTDKKWFSKLIMFTVLSVNTHLVHSARCSLCLSCSARCRLQCKVQAARQEVVTAASPGTPIFPPPPCPHRPTIGSKLSTLLPAQQTPILSKPFCSQLHSLELQLRLTFSLVHPNRWSPPSWSSTQTSARIPTALTKVWSTICRNFNQLDKNLLTI